MTDLAGLAANVIAGGAPRSAVQGETNIEPGTYRNRAALVPAAVPVVPAWHPAPSGSGLHSARVVGIDNEALSTERDHRVKIQFPWQRGQAPNRAYTALSAGTQLHATAQADAQFDAAQTLSAVLGNATSLFTHADGIHAIAANAPVSIQAHTDRLSVLGDQSV